MPEICFPSLSKSRSQLLAPVVNSPLFPKILSRSRGRRKENAKIQQVLLPSFFFSLLDKFLCCREVEKTRGNKTRTKFGSRSQLISSLPFPSLRSAPAPPFKVIPTRLIVVLIFGGRARTHTHRRLDLTQKEEKKWARLWCCLPCNISERCGVGGGRVKGERRRRPSKRESAYQTRGMKVG